MIDRRKLDGMMGMFEMEAAIYTMLQMADKQGVFSLPS